MQALRPVLARLEDLLHTRAPAGPSAAPAPAPRDASETPVATEGSQDPAAPTAPPQIDSSAGAHYLRGHDMPPLATLLAVANPRIDLWRDCAATERDRKQLADVLSKCRSIPTRPARCAGGAPSVAHLVPPWLQQLQQRVPALPVPLTLALFSAAARQLQASGRSRGANGGTSGIDEAHAACDVRAARAAVLLGGMHTWFNSKAHLPHRGATADDAVLEAAAIAQSLDVHIKESTRVWCAATGPLMSMMLQDLGLEMSRLAPLPKHWFSNSYLARHESKVRVRLQRRVQALARSNKFARGRFEQLAGTAGEAPGAELFCAGGLHGSNVAAVRRGRAAGLAWLQARYCETWCRAARGTASHMLSGGLDASMDLFLQAAAMHWVPHGGPMKQTAKLLEEVRWHHASRVTARRCCRAGRPHHRALVALLRHSTPPVQTLLSRVPPAPL